MTPSTPEPEIAPPLEALTSGESGSASNWIRPSHPHPHAATSVRLSELSVVRPYFVNRFPYFNCAR